MVSSTTEQQKKERRKADYLKIFIWNVLLFILGVHRKVFVVRRIGIQVHCLWVRYLPPLLSTLLFADLLASGRIHDGRDSLPVYLATKVNRIRRLLPLCDRRKHYFTHERKKKTRGTNRCKQVCGMTPIGVKQRLRLNIIIGMVRSKEI